MDHLQIMNEAYHDNVAKMEGGPFDGLVICGPEPFSEREVVIRAEMFALKERVVVNATYRFLGNDFKRLKYVDIERVE